MQSRLIILCLIFVLLLIQCAPHQASRVIIPETPTSILLQTVTETTSATNEAGCSKVLTSSAGLPTNSVSDSSAVVLPNSAVVLALSDGDILGANWDATQIVHLTHDPASDDFPAWSPDGQQLAFASKRGGKYGIYLIQADGSNLVRIADGTQPAWSPDGQQLAFVSGYASVESLFVWNQHAGVSTLLQLERLIASPTWSPNGTYLVVTTIAAGHMFLERITVADTTLQRLAKGSHPAWSPDGAAIAFRDENADIALVTPDGSCRLTLATADGYGYDYPAWSPDGQRLAFVSQQYGAIDAPIAIVIVDRDGTDERRIAESEGVYSSLTWSPDGRYLAFWYQNVARTLDGVQIVQVDGTPVTEIDRAVRPVWRPQR